MDCSTPGSPVLHYLPEFAQIHAHWVGDAIQPSHPLVPHSPLTFSLSQHQGLFSMSQLFPSRGQSIGASALASVLLVNVQGWSPLGLTDLISLQSKRLSRVFSKHHDLKASVLWHSALFMVQPSCPYMTTRKTIALTIWTLLAKWSLCYVCHSFLSYEKIYINKISLNYMSPHTFHSSTLAWKIPWMEESGRLESMGSLRVGYDRATSLSLFTFMHWRRKWQPTPVFLPGESHGRWGLVGCRLWGCTESDMTEAT